MKYDFLLFQGIKRAEISNLIDTYVSGTVGQVYKSVIFIILDAMLVGC